MEALRRCPDLAVRLERELGARGLTIVTQTDALAVISAVARAVGGSTGVANLFSVPKPVSTTEFIAQVTRQVSGGDDNFADTLAELENALGEEEEELQEVPIPSKKGLDSLMSQMTKWQLNDASSSEEESDEEDNQKIIPRRVDSDPEDSSSSSDEEESSDSFVTRLFDDPSALSTFTKELFTTANPQGLAKIPKAQLQVVLDTLTEKGFAASRLKKHLEHLLRVDFAQINELNYAHFAFFVRSLLSRSTQ